MIYLSLPTPRPPRRLPFFLAMEEWAASSLPDAEYFFVWQQDGPTIICGRNQTIPLEVDLPLCRRSGIDVVRRRSGGGAVVADENNLMLSYIRPRKGQPVESIFSEWSEKLVGALRQLGVDANVTGRNDVCINGRKVSGGAFYALPRHAIAHSTMLFRLPPTSLTSALTPDRAKLESKGVKSVASRITSLTDEGLTLSKDEFSEKISALLCSEKLELTAADVKAIEELEKAYYLTSFMRLDECGDDAANKIHTKSAGQICAVFRTRGGRISGLRLSGDFFALDDVGLIENALEGLSPEELPAAIEALAPEKIIRGLDARTLLSLLS